MKGQTKKQSDIAPTPLPGVMRINPHMVMSEVNGQDKLIKLCSNESALGPSPRALSSANKALEHAHHYFEYGMFELQQAIADCFDLDPDSVACGNGSDDLIARLVRSFIRPGDELIRSANGYAKYINYAHAAGAVSISAQDNNFRADVQSILEAVTDHTRMIMLANPDNPTGSMLSKDEVQYLHDSIPNNVLLLLDSAYAEYVDNPDYETPVNLIEKNENVVMTRTFSKLFGLAGLRLGWLYGPPVVVDAVKRIGLTFPVNNVAAAAGITSTKDRD